MTEACEVFCGLRCGLIGAEGFSDLWTSGVWLLGPKSRIRLV